MFLLGSYHTYTLTLLHSLVFTQNAFDQTAQPLASFSIFVRELGLA